MPQIILLGQFTLMIKKTNNRKVSPAFLQTSRSYQSWNASTAECFHQKLNCNCCPSRKDCQLQVMYKNPYNIRNMKYAVLMTYANIGEKGIDRYYEKLAKS